jgi:hypothetical protein
MDWDFIEAKLQGGLVPGVADDDDPLFVDHDRLPKAKLTNGSSNGFHGCVV